MYDVRTGTIVLPSGEDKITAEAAAAKKAAKVRVAPPRGFGSDGNAISLNEA